MRRETTLESPSTAPSATEKRRSTCGEGFSEADTWSLGRENRGPARGDSEPRRPGRAVHGPQRAHVGEKIRDAPRAEQGCTSEPCAAPGPAPRASASRTSPIGCSVTNRRETAAKEGTLLSRQAHPRRPSAPRAQRVNYTREPEIGQRGVASPHHPDQRAPGKKWGHHPGRMDKRQYDLERTESQDRPRRNTRNGFAALCCRLPGATAKAPSCSQDRLPAEP